jgi:hypothetical protein
MGSDRLHATKQLIVHDSINAPKLFTAAVIHERGIELRDGPRVASNVQVLRVCTARCD